MFDIPLTITRGLSFGPVLVYCKDAQGAAFPLSGWKAFAEIRHDPGLHRPRVLVCNLAPVIAENDTAGLVTIPAIGHAATALFNECEDAWDLILEDASGYRSLPVAGGVVTIESINTQPVPA